MALSRKRRRSITVRNLNFHWTLRCIEEGDSLFHIRQDTDSLARLNVGFYYPRGEKKYFPMAKRPRNIEKGRYYDHEALAFSLKVLEIVITWALDNG